MEPELDRARPGPGDEPLSPPWDAFADYRDLRIDFGHFCRQVEVVYEVLVSDDGYSSSWQVDPSCRIPVLIPHLAAALKACVEGRLTPEDGVRWGWLMMMCEAYTPFPLGAQSARMQDAGRVALRQLSERVTGDPPDTAFFEELLWSLS